MSEDLLRRAIAFAIAELREALGFLEDAMHNAPWAAVVKIPVERAVKVLEQGKKQ